MGIWDSITGKEDEMDDTVNLGGFSTDGTAGIALFEPKTFEEATLIADKIKAGSCAAVNLHRLTKDYSQRTIDFLTGVVYAADGRIEKVGHNLILCSPASITVSGNITMSTTQD